MRVKPTLPSLGALRRIASRPAWHHVSAGLFMGASALVLSGNAALALTADELREEVVASMDLPFGLSMIGGVKGADISVSGDGPFEVTIQGGYIAGQALPTLQYSVTEISDDTWRVSGAKFDGPLEFKLDDLPLSINGSGWSGTWSRSQQDYLDGNFVVGGFGLRLGSALEVDFGGFEIISEPFDALTKKQAGEMIMKPFSFLMDGNAEGSDLPADMSQTMKMGETNYRYVLELDGPMGNFAPFQAIADAFVFGPQLGEDAELRKAWLLDLVDSMFADYRSLSGTIKTGEQSQTMSSPEFNAEMTTDTQNAVAEFSNEDGMLSGSIESQSGSTFARLTSDKEALANGELRVGGATSAIKIIDMDLALLEAALVRLIETGNDNPMAVDFKAFEDLIAGLGGLSAEVGVQDVNVMSSAMGPLFTLGALSYGLDAGIPADDLVRSGLSIGLEDLQVPIISAMTGLPASVLPSDVNLGVSLDYPSLSLFATDIGMDRVVQISLSSDDGDEAMETLLPEIAEVVRQNALAFNIDLGVKSQDYDVAITGRMDLEMLAADDPAAEIFPAKAKAHIEVTGFDGLMTRMQQLVAETENPEIQSGISGMLLGLGMARGMARPDGDKLIYDIVLDPAGESTINDIPLPQ